jgi:hypothetical protein
LVPDRHFPPPWSVEEMEAWFIVRDHDGQALAYVYFEDEPGRRAAANLLTRDEAHRIEGNIAKIPRTGAAGRRRDWSESCHKQVAKPPHLGARPRARTTMHIRQNPTAGLSARAALLWIAVISVVMTLAVVFADHTPPS